MRLTRKTTSRVRTRTARHSGSDVTAGEPVMQGSQQSVLFGTAKSILLSLPPQMAQIMFVQGICTQHWCTLWTCCCHPTPADPGPLSILCTLICASLL